ncbi:hypothetical protein ACPVTF_15330 [Geobacillus icigianus]|uniref:hypothetical protein n=1 Tax=Geobacillus icigianus TaxID=1430331 RepID=UPI003CFFEBE5
MKTLKMIEEAVKVTQSNLNKNDIDEETRELELRKLNALMEIVSYVKSLAWLKQSQAKEKMRFLIKTKFNYERTKKEFNISSINAVEVFVSYANKKLLEKIGKDTVDLILRGEVDSAMAQFRANTGHDHQNLDFFIPGIAKFLPHPEKHKFMLLTECEEELILLGNLSHFMVSSMFEKADKMKLAHLLYILNSEDKKYEAEKELITRFLNGEFAEVDGYKLSIESQVARVFKELDQQNLFI